MSKKRAYIIYECEHGWCYQPTTISIVRERPEATKAFSRLSQLTWELLKQDREARHD